MKAFVKQVFAVGMVASLLATTFNATATYVTGENTIPDSGLMFSDDFESFDASRYKDVYDASVINLDGHGKVMATKPSIKNESANAGFYINLNTLGYDSDYTTCIREGQILISHDVYVPSHTTDGELINYNDSNSSYAQYLMNYGIKANAKPGNYSTAAWEANGGIFYAVHYSNEKPYITFNKTLANFVEGRETAYAIDISNDTWYNVETCIDYDNSSIYYYLDGKYVGEYIGTDLKNVIQQNYALFQLQVSAKGTFDASSENPSVYYDNYNIKVLKANSFDVVLDKCGDDYIDLKTNYSVDVDYIKNLKASSIKLVVGNDEYTATDYDVIGTDIIRVNFNTKITSNGIYNLVIGSKSDKSTYIRSIYGDTYGLVSPGKELSFIPQAIGQEEDIDIINLDFDDDDDFATKANSEDFSKYTYVRSRISEDYDFVCDAEQTYKYCYKGQDQTGGGLLNLDLLDSIGVGIDPDGTQRNLKAVRFPFEDGRIVSNGKVYINFDAGIYPNDSNGNKQTLRVMFGLENTLNQENTYIFRGETANDEVWTNTTCLLGLSYWTNKIHSLTYASKDYRTRTCDWQRENNGAKTNNQIMTVNDGTMHHYSITVDLSNKKYEISVDDGMSTKVDYLPGNETKGKYDAFVMTLLDPNLLMSGMAKIDNLRVSVPSAKTPNIETVKFYDLDDNEIPYASVMTSKTARVSIKFNQAVVLDKDYFVIDGLNENDYNLAYDKDDEGTTQQDTVIINLENCLNQDKKYLLKVVSDLEMAGSDSTFGRDFVLAFSRANDGGLNYIKPVIDLKSARVTANVMNFTSGKVAGKVTVVGYKNKNGVSTLCGVKYNSFEVESNKVANIVLGDSADISSLLDMGAEKIAVFVFDGEDTLKLNTYNIAVIGN